MKHIAGVKHTIFTNIRVIVLLAGYYFIGMVAEILFFRQIPVEVSGGHESTRLVSNTCIVVGVLLFMLLYRRVPSQKRFVRYGYAACVAALVLVLALPGVVPFWGCLLLHYVSLGICGCDVLYRLNFVPRSITGKIFAFSAGAGISVQILLCNSTLTTPVLMVIGALVLVGMALATDTPRINLRPARQKPSTVRRAAYFGLLVILMSLLSGMVSGLIALEYKDYARLLSESSRWLLVFSMLLAGVIADFKIRSLLPIFTVSSMLIFALLTTFFNIPVMYPYITLLLNLSGGFVSVFYVLAFIDIARMNGMSPVLANIGRLCKFFGATLSAGFVLLNKDASPATSILLSAGLVSVIVLVFSFDKAAREAHKLEQHKHPHKERIAELLCTAIEDRTVSLVYQPQIDSITGQMKGMEALMRFSHPELGAISPSDFIPIAEETNTICELGLWALQEAIEAGERLANSGVAFAHISVNISVVQLRDSDFCAEVKSLLAAYDFSPEWLHLEITESVLMDNTNMLIDSIGKLKELGVQIELDDFGTGYSSLNYLSHLPLDVIKVDKKFIDKIGASAEDEFLLEFIIALIKKLNLISIAEGVESLEQIEFLKARGVSLIQGYYYSKPIKEAEIVQKYRFAPTM